MKTTSIILGIVALTVSIVLLRFGQLKPCVWVVEYQQVLLQALCAVSLFNLLAVILASKNAKLLLSIAQISFGVLLMIFMYWMIPIIENKNQFFLFQIGIPLVIVLPLANIFLEYILKD